MPTLNLDAALFTVLNADGTLTADLATYDKGSGAAPAIFTGWVPATSGRPYVFIHPAGSSEPFDTKTTEGREARVQIDAVTDAQGSTVLVNRIAERIRELLHRTPPTITGFGARIADVSGPVNGESDENVYVRTCTVRLIAEET